MRRAVMKIALRAYTTWLADLLPPSGKVFTPDLEAECLTIIDVIPPGTGPDITDVKALNEEGLITIYEWMFAALVQANIGNRGWGLAAHLLRLLAIQHVDDIMEKIRSPRTLSHPASPTPNKGVN